MGVIPAPPPPPNPEFKHQWKALLQVCYFPRDTFIAKDMWFPIHLEETQVLDVASAIPAFVALE